MQARAGTAFCRNRRVIVEGMSRRRSVFRTIGEEENENYGSVEIIGAGEEVRATIGGEVLATLSDVTPEFWPAMTWDGLGLGAGVGVTTTVPPPGGRGRSCA